MPDSVHTELRSTIRSLVQSRKVSLTRTGAGEGASPVAPAYPWNKYIAFGQNTDGRQYFGSGWSLDEPGYVWTEGAVSELRFAVDVPSADVVLKMRARAFVPPGASSHCVHIRLKGRAVAIWHVTSDFGWHSAILFRHQVEDSPTLQLTIEPASPASPRSVGVGNDDRLLAMALAEMVMEAKA